MRWRWSHRLAARVTSGIRSGRVFVSQGFMPWTPRRSVAALLLACAALLLASHAALADFLQQGNKLVGTGAASAATQGQSVALSADGNIAIVGGPFDNSGTGAAWVFTRSGGAWSQQGSKLVGAGAVGASNQGYSV